MYYTKEFNLVKLTLTCSNSKYDDDDGTKTLSPRCDLHNAKIRSARHHAHSQARAFSQPVEPTKAKTQLCTRLQEEENCYSFFQNGQFALWLKLGFEFVSARGLLNSQKVARNRS